MSYHRRPRTTQERRANQDGLARGKRSKRYLPNTWDDVKVAARRDRSWKRRRRTKWRAVDLT